jgi:diphthine-ammonia ligase
MTYCASWSGGKDSCLASYLARERGLVISHLVHFDRPNNLHGVDPAMIALQAKLAGIPLVQEQVDPADFEKEFKRTITDLKAQGVSGMVFGDIYLEPHKEWVDRTCQELGIIAEEPLWGRNTESIMQDFFARGFETTVASGDQKLIGKEWIGRKMDEAFIAYLKERNLDVCGESGEFHTFVTAGPLFRGRIEISRSDVTERDGFWFLDLQDFRVVR